MAFSAIHQFILWKLKKRTKVTTMDDLYADFGFFSDKEANENGVEVGNVVLITGETVFLENPDLVAEKVYGQ